MAITSFQRGAFARRELAWLERYPPRRRPMNDRIYRALKRAMDLTLCSLTLPLLLPVFLLCVLAIKLDSPGAPALFTQLRTGRDGKRFRMYKFRTMVPNAEAMKKELMHLNELQWPDFKITNDPRITRVGRVLRKTSLDELPQLINVFLGHMSLVGPRPTSFAASTYRLWQTHRLSVTPGLTGLWQVYGRAQTEFDERLRLDIAYIERRCLRLDIELLFRTVTAVLAARGAH
jgi:lipopolysaccharide/colanic/teichoic acid biosynthesis glycosyltransferase